MKDSNIDSQRFEAPENFNAQTGKIILELGYSEENFRKPPKNKEYYYLTLAPELREWYRKLQAEKLIDQAEAVVTSVVIDRGSAALHCGCSVCQREGDSIANWYFTNPKL